MAYSEPLWRAFSFEFERLCAVLRRKGSSGNVPVDEAIFFPRRKTKRPTPIHISSIIAFDETMLASAWQRKTNTSITMQRMDENQFPDGLDMLNKRKEEQLEQRRVRAAIKASKKAYNAMKIALDIEQNFSSPANVRGTKPESSGDSSSESSSGDKSPRAPGKLKLKKPLGRNAPSDDEDGELIEAAIAQAQAERDGLESSGSNGGESPRAPRKEKKPKAKKELAKRAKEIRRLRVT